MSSYKTDWILSESRVVFTHDWTLTEPHVLSWHMTDWIRTESLNRCSVLPFISHDQQCNECALVGECFCLCEISINVNKLFLVYFVYVRPWRIVVALYTLSFCTALCCCFFFLSLHTYKHNWSLKTYRQDYDLVSHTTGPTVYSRFRTTDFIRKLLRDDHRINMFSSFVLLEMSDPEFESLLISLHTIYYTTSEF